MMKMKIQLGTHKSLSLSFQLFGNVLVVIKVAVVLPVFVLLIQIIVRYAVV